jgi:2-polyprenyl-3-methyl-5-hydroxy-6-metoxy-1,4-benzoquinol methylase
VDQNLLNDEFYSWHKKYTHNDSVKVGMELFKHFKPKSVIDFGCGIGSYLYAAKQCGIKKIKGLEIGGNFAKEYTDESVRELIDFNTDITKPISPGFFDISMCIEVAEHVEMQGSSQLVKNIAKATKQFCIWSAAPPGQDGCGHVNCHEKEYWTNLFLLEDMKPSDKEDEVRICMKGSPDYIMNNLMVFCHG